MATPPLQLENSFISALEVEALPDGNAAEPTRLQGRADVALGQNSQEPSQWHVQLDVHIDPDEEHPAPYRIHLRMHGFFRLPADMPVDQATPLLGVTGASILYSAARELLVLVTGRGPWGPWHLPTTRFEPPKSTAESPKMASASSHSSPAKRPRRRSGQQESR